MNGNLFLLRRIEKSEEAQRHRRYYLEESLEWRSLLHGLPPVSQMSDVVEVLGNVISSDSVSDGFVTIGHGRVSPTQSLTSKDTVHL